MKKEFVVLVAAVFVMAAGSASAQMGSGHMSGAMGTGSMGTGSMGGGYAAGSTGYGMHGAGGMVSGLMGNTLSHGYLDVLDPIATPAEAREKIQAFLAGSNTELQISELWEYGAAYRAELVDADGEKAFDLLVDKFTGTVAPEMGFSMMLNSSYGNSLYRMPRLGNNLALTADQATAAAQGFIDRNSLGYTLAAPETYPGYYKFHTTNAAGFGMDIMVNGADGGIWMSTILGLPLNHY